jgi:hypothetical protein
MQVAVTKQCDPTRTNETEKFEGGKSIMSYYVVKIRTHKKLHPTRAKTMSDTLLPTFVLRGHAAEVATIELDNTNSKLLSGFV